MLNETKQLVRELHKLYATHNKTNHFSPTYLRNEWRMKHDNKQQTTHSIELYETPYDEYR
jgi:hypothetical protein